MVPTLSKIQLSHWEKEEKGKKILRSHTHNVWSPEQQGFCPVISRAFGMLVISSTWSSTPSPPGSVAHFLQNAPYPIAVFKVVFPMTCLKTSRFHCCRQEQNEPCFLWGVEMWIKQVRVTSYMTCVWRGLGKAKALVKLLVDTAKTKKCLLVQTCPAQTADRQC